MITSHKYLAFISYDNSDVEFAKFLKEQIEQGQFPESVTGKRRLPSEKRRVFVSDVDFNGTTVGGILDEVRNAKFLIPLCTPKYPDNRLCNEEVNAFIKHNGKKAVKRIIPYIVSNGDGVTPTRQFFPPALLKVDRMDQSFGINESKYQGGRAESVQRLMARLLDIVEREKKRRKTIIAICAFAALVAGLALFNEYRTTSAYYADYVLRNGIPEGLFQMTRKELAASQRPAFKFDYRQGKVRKVSYCDSYGVVQRITQTEWIDRFPIMEYTYPSDNKHEVTIKDQFGATLCRWAVYVDPDAGSYIINVEDDHSGLGISTVSAAQSNIFERKHYIDLYDDINSSKAPIRSYKVFMDTEGYDARKLFGLYHGYNDVPAQDVNGIEGFLYERNDSLHRLTKITYINHRGEPVSDPQGVSSRDYIYDGAGNMAESFYRNRDGELTLNERHWAHGKDVFDEHRRLIREEYYGPDDKPIINTEGIASSTVEYEDNTVTYRIYDEKGEPTLSLISYNNSQIYHIASVTTSKNGRRRTSSFYGKDGKPISVYGYSRYMEEESKDGRRISISYYDSDDEPVNTSGGYHKVVEYLNQDGDCIRTEIIDRSGDFANSLAAPTFTYRKFDNYHNAIEELYFDKDRRPMQNKAYFGAFGVRAYYTNNMRDSVVFLDASHSMPMDCQNGFAISRYEHDEAGRIIRQRAFHASGEPALFSNDEGETCHDMRMDMAMDCSFGVRSEYGINNDLLRRYLIIYEDGRIIEKRRIDESGDPEDSIDGIAITRYSYTNGLPSSTKFFNASGEPAMKPSCGAYEFRQEYEGGVMKSVTYWDKDGEPMLDLNEQVWKIDYTYMAPGQVTKTTRYGKDGLKCNNNIGICEEVYEYDLLGNQCRYAVYDKDGAPTETGINVHEFISEFDSTSSPVKFTYRRKDGSLTLGPEGYAELLYRYDSSHRHYAWLALDEELKPASLKNNDYPIQMRIFLNDGSAMNLMYDQYGEMVGFYVPDFQGSYEACYQNWDLYLRNRATGEVETKYGEEKKELMKALNELIMQGKEDYARREGISLEPEDLGFSFYEP